MKQVKYIILFLLLIITSNLYALSEEENLQLYRERFDKGIQATHELYNYVISNENHKEVINEIPVKVIKEEIKRDAKIEYLEVDYEKDGEVIGKKIIATGTKNHVDWNCSNVINEAKKIQADKVVLIHNHPSGNINASEQDRITKEEVSKKMDKENIKSEFVIVTKYQERKY